MKKIFLLAFLIICAFSISVPNSSENYSENQYLDFEDTNSPEYVKG